MGGSGFKAGAVGVCGCRLYCIHSCPVGCGGGWHGADAGVEELYIVCRHEAHPQTVEQSSERGVGPLALGHLRLEYNECGEEGDVQGLAQSLRTLGRRGDFLAGWCISIGAVAGSDRR